MSRALDTSEDADRVQLDILRRMGPDERLRRAFALTRTVRELSVEGIRMRHPEYGPAEARWAAFRLWLGPALFAQAYPDAPVLAP